MQDYEVIKCIGEGSFGKALLVKHIESQELRVIKQVDLSQQNETIQEASLRESNLLSELDHPNIIRFYDSFLEGDVLCTVMEYAAGGDIASKIAEAKGMHFPEFVIISWFAQMCLGLQYIHSHHILHRDIKSQNIFLDADGNVKIGDFGTAKCLEETGEFAETVVGSPFYLSPEICQGVPYNAKTDIWSLGCVLYELCTLVPAFSGDCIGGIVMKILRSEQPPIPGEYSSDLSNLVDSMLQKNPCRRPTITQILSLSFLKPVLPISSVSQVVIHRMSDEKIKEKRPQSKLVQPKEKKPVEIPPKEEIGLCLMVTNLQTNESQAQIKANVQKDRHVLNVRKSGHPLTKKSKIQSNRRVVREEDAIAELPTCLTSYHINTDTKSDEDFMNGNVAASSAEKSLEEIEQMRMYLEKLLGTEVLLNAYNAIKKGENAKWVLEIMGTQHRKAAVLLQRLILLEENINAV
ncbi:AGC family protein kinase [Trichomonas vaginalis G3]|uniref:non-specific serine/threonine protein kinase n=1 Tax=Trichomonas vaginalis (strain ATCC PRA-98 / G3) TaxID=412133 RepID=A2E3M4_TRIV3|nr:STKc Nek domain-containing protein [Trichomonas vaginalis G3]EAY12790.1 AGC family protein kinase [Trichomonas vaginalis G3]KAI5505587.1 STKc Nek domain-containing protein [Trichomonas vaginalis G3]|eukprot:XP_001325013.1 AGC family protein kinase [Trichomonas vaginalis G3]